jgi:outer membrane lipoprotein SlyB
MSVPLVDERAYERLRTTGRRRVATVRRRGESVTLEPFPERSMTSTAELPRTNTLHPLLAVAAASVILLSATGIAAMTGLIGTPKATPHGGQPAPAVSAAEPQPAAAAAPIAAQAAPQAAPVHAVPAPEPRATAPRPQPAARTVATRPPAPVASDPPPASVAAQQQPAHPAPPAPVAAPAAVAPPVETQTWATVESLREVRSTGDAQGIGAVAGGVLGGVLGNQVGKGSGRKAMTVVGAVGGGVLGHQIERQARGSTRHDVTVRLGDGSLRTFSRDVPWSLQPGDRVRIADGEIVAASTPGGSPSAGFGGFREAGVN